jgi:hypothetical protein
MIINLLFDTGSRYRRRIVMSQPYNGSGSEIDIQYE